MQGGWVGKGEEMEGRALIYVKQVQFCQLAQLSHAMNPALSPTPPGHETAANGHVSFRAGFWGVSKVMAPVVSHQ